MAKTVKFIDLNTILLVPGIGRITSANITLELYERLVKLSDSHSKLFIVTDEEVKHKSKSDKNENDIQAEKP